MNPDPRSSAQIQLNELGQLAAGVGHNVINAFAAIVSNAEIYRLLGDDPTFQPTDRLNLAETIIRTALDASTVARRLIDYSRSATTPGDSIVHLNEVAAAAVEYEQAHANNSDVTWQLELAPVPPVQGEAPQLTAMLSHIFANAREALPHSGGIIRVASKQDDRGWIVLEVSDTGRGMTSEEQDRAVEPFFSTKPGHFGVGLSIANGIWRRHRGTLAVRSALDEGALVRLCIEPVTHRR